MKEPSINELKEERKRLEVNLLSSTGRNQVQISKLPSTLNSYKNNRSINSPIMSNKVSPSPPTSASSTRSKVSILSANMISINDNSPKTTIKTHSVKQNGVQIDRKKTTENINSINQTKRSSSLVSESRKSSQLVNTTNPQTKRSILNNAPKLPVKTTSKTNQSSLVNLNKEISEHQNHNFSRPISVSSTGSTSSLSMSASSRSSAVQKFRQMVLESRDT